MHESYLSAYYLKVLEQYRHSEPVDSEDTRKSYFEVYWSSLK